MTMRKAKSIGQNYKKYKVRRTKRKNKMKWSKRQTDRKTD